MPRDLLARLRRLGACREALQWAASRPVREHPADTLRACPKAYWILWLASETGTPIPGIDGVVAEWRQRARSAFSALAARLPEASGVACAASPADALLAAEAHGAAAVAAVGGPEETESAAMAAAWSARWAMSAREPEAVAEGLAWSAAWAAPWEREAEAEASEHARQMGELLAVVDADALSLALAAALLRVRRWGNNAQWWPKDVL